jgi:AcrR family transcriptional regulator
MATGTRERIVGASAELFRRQGYTGTGLKQIVASADAPFGSVYHFFPGGKAQLGEEVIRSGGELYLRLFETFMDAAPDVVSGVRSFFEGAGELLRTTNYADACPIATIALEVASTNEPLRLATADVFESWIIGAGARFNAAGMADADARTLAITLIALIEGGFMLSRAARTTEAMDAAGAAAVTATRAALPHGRRPRRSAR